MSLCVHCALCCDGTLFSRVPLTPTEAKRLEARGLEVRRRKNGSWSLPQACQALEGCRCTVYEARPSSCSAFRCKLLQAVDEGRVTLPEAVRIVEGARALRRKGVDRELDAYLTAHFHEA